MVKPLTGLKLRRNRWLVLVALVMALICIVLLILWQNISAYERSRVYHPELTAFPQEPLKAVQHRALGARIEDIYFQTRDNVRLNAWFIPAKPGKPTIIYAHGNSGNMGDRVDVMELFTRQGYGFLAFDYRGYGKSQGVPSEQGLYRDLEAASQYLIRQKHIPVSQQIALGGSLGSGVVVDVATRIPFRAVIIFATLTSTPDVAEHLFRNTKWRYVPFQLGMQHRFESEKKIQNIQSPLIIMHGAEDQMMPLRMPETLFKKAKTPYKKLIVIKHANHDNVLIQGKNELLTALQTLLTQTIDYK